MHLSQLRLLSAVCRLSFCFTHTPPSEIYTLSLHDALPISSLTMPPEISPYTTACTSRSTRKDSCGRSITAQVITLPMRDRKSTRLNSSHRCISYAVFCLKKKKIEDDVLIVAALVKWRLLSC